MLSEDAATSPLTAGMTTTPAPSVIPLATTCGAMLLAAAPSTGSHAQHPIRSRRELSMLHRAWCRRPLLRDAATTLVLHAEDISDADLIRLFSLSSPATLPPSSSSQPPPFDDAGDLRPPIPSRLPSAVGCATSKADDARQPPSSSLGEVVTVALRPPPGTMMMAALATLDLGHCPQLTDAALRLLSSSTLPSLHHLVLDGCWKLTDQGIAAALASLVSLTSLDVTGCWQVTDASAAHMAAMPSLTDLIIARCWQISDAGVAKLFGNEESNSDDIPPQATTNDGVRSIRDRRAPSGSPRILRLVDGRDDGGDLEDGVRLMAAAQEHLPPRRDGERDTPRVPANSLARLTTLNLSHCCKITDAGVASIAFGGSLGTLRCVDLSYCALVTDAGVAHLRSMSTTLSTLRLAGSQKLTDEATLHLAAIGSITELDLARCSKITDVGVARLAELTKLESLNLSECAFVSDAGVAQLASLTALATLRLADCGGIKGNCLPSLKRLAHLDLSGCSRITDASLSQVARMLQPQLPLGDASPPSDTIMPSAASSQLKTLDVSRCANVSHEGVASFVNSGVHVTVSMRVRVAVEEI